MKNEQKLGADPAVVSATSEDQVPRARGLLSGTQRAAAEWMPIEAVRKWERNPKRRTEADIREAMGSLRRFGFCAPMVVWESKSMLVAGHARLAAMAAIIEEDPSLDGRGNSDPDLAEKNRKLLQSLTGPTPAHVPVRLREFASMSEAEAYALRDNNDFGETDNDELARIVADLQADGTDVGGLGWSEDELAKMLGAPGEDKFGPDDFPEKDEGIDVNRQCPKCGYEWSATQ